MDDHFPHLQIFFEVFELCKLSPDVPYMPAKWLQLLAHFFFCIRYLCTNKLHIKNDFPCRSSVIFFWFVGSQLYFSPFVASRLTSFTPSSEAY